MGGLCSFLDFVGEGRSPEGGLLEGGDFGLNFGLEELGKLDGLS